MATCSGGPQAAGCRYGDIQVNGAGLPTVPGEGCKQLCFCYSSVLELKQVFLLEIVLLSLLVFHSSSDELTCQYGAMVSRGIREELDKLRLSRYNLKQRCWLC